MSLFSLGYLMFNGILLILYYTVCRRKQWILLLAASLFYYTLLSGQGMVYLLLHALVTYAGARRLSSLEDACRIRRKDPSLDREGKKKVKAAFTRRKRVVLWTVIILHLLVLARLKYWTDLFPSAPSLLLPLGISFYTFMSISYLVDVYGGKYPAEQNFARLLLYLSWFPQMIQGPIGRYPDMAPQFQKTHTFDSDRARRGMLLILFGLLKKYVVADMLVNEISDLFDGPVDGLPGSLIVFGILLYSAQQYADFSGGIDIVAGFSSLFGIELAPNFRQPYFSTSLGDFWRRWHISLGAFMRDYVFYPFALLKPMQKFGKWCTKHLGKHAGRVLPACIANILVFFIVGIWHGAQLHYVLWGLYNGLVIALSDLTAPFWTGLANKLHMNTESKGFHVFRIIRTFVIVNIGWYFDRITDFRSCMTCLARTVTHFDAGHFASALVQEFCTGSDKVTVFGSMALALVGCIVIFVVSFRKETGHDVSGELMAGKPAVQGVLVMLSLMLILSSFLFTTSAGGFLYANF